DFRDLTTLATPAPATATTDPATVATNASQTARASTPPWGQVNTEGFAARDTGLNIGVITNNVSVFIHAVEEAHDATVLSNPKVLALNKQTAEVNVGDQIGYRSQTTMTETSETMDVQFMDIGTRLVFRPFISEDGYVRLEVHPEVSERGLETLNNIPSKSTVEATCNVMVKDGHTIVIGGLFQETADITRSQVPGLGNIPLLGWLFRRNGDTTTRSEIIILLTPHIIADDEAADAIGRQVFADGKRRCLGMREGFSFFTRERITTGYVDEADRAWRSYGTTRSPKDLDRAWWNVRLALNVAPNNLAAMRLHDQILTEKNGAPHEPPNWTIWDTVHDRVKAAFGPEASEADKAEVPAPDAKTDAGPEPAPKEADHAR
ncbi:MAG: type II and III secretion system protein, partial [Planctomycetes bacterium]|nr:type II and III secretion system protein [Planctomycetota bacterium]